MRSPARILILAMLLLVNLGDQSGRAKRYGLGMLRNQDEKEIQQYGTEKSEEARRERGSDGGDAMARWWWCARGCAGV